MTKRGVVYKSYNFTKKDPAIDAARTLVKDSDMSFEDIHAAGGPTPKTLDGWFNGETQRPQFASLMATVRACDGDIILVTKSGTQIKINSKKK